MPINYLNKDITTVDYGIILHGVNCQGAMGSGVAKAIKDKWPVVYQEYLKQPTGRAMLGAVNMVYVNDNLYVANCYTQEFYGRDKQKYASADAIFQCLQQCATYGKVLALPLYMPRIGCGLGGLNWHLDVEPCVRKIDNGIEINICDL